MTEFVDQKAKIDQWGSHEFDRALGAYTVVCVKDSDPDYDEISEITTRIQGEDYVRSGYIEPEKLDSEGRLLDPLDRRRIVTRFVAFPESTGYDSIEGAVKVLQIPEGGDLYMLAAYEYSDVVLFPEYRARIQEAYENDPVRGVVEVGGLTRIEHPTSKLVPYELIRELMQQAVRSNTNEKWLITFTKKAFLPIMASFGPDVICVAGEEVTINASDEHVTLVPCLIEPCVLVDNMVTAIETTNDVALKRHRLEVFILMTDGLQASEMTPRARQLAASLAKETVA